MQNNTLKNKVAGVPFDKSENSVAGVNRHLVPRDIISATPSGVAMPLNFRSSKK